MSTNPQRKPGLVLDPAADGVFASHPGGDSLTWLNRTAVLVLELCTGANDTASIAAAVAQAFDLNEAPLTAVRDTIADLVAAGLVSPGDVVPGTHHALVVAAWTPKDSVAVDALTQVHELLVEAAGHGFEASLTLDSSLSLRTARNRVASRIVQEATATHVLFLDATKRAMDAVRGCDLRSLVESHHEVIGIPISVGKPDWERARQALIAIPDLTARELEHYAQGYAVSLPPTAEAGAVDAVFVEGTYCSSGAMLVRRSALDRLAGSGVANRHHGNVAMGALTTAGGWGFFDPGMTNDGIDLDEDLAFCERIRASGGRVMIDVDGAFGTRLQVTARLRAHGR